MILIHLVFHRKNVTESQQWKLGCLFGGGGKQIMGDWGEAARNNNIDHALKSQCSLKLLGATAPSLDTYAKWCLQSTIPCTVVAISKVIQMKSVK